MKNTELIAHKKVLLIINPHSRSAASLKEDILKCLAEEHIEILNHDSESDNLAPDELIRKYHSEIDAVLVAGGDGSVNITLCALKDTGLPLLVIPCGTANNLARHYDIPSEITENLKLLKSGKEIIVDIGLVNDIPFINVAGLGLSTEVNRKVSKNLKKFFGVTAFIMTALQLAVKMNPFRAVITTDKKISVPTKSWQISICNGKHYGAGMTIKHDASLHDGKLHLLSTEVKNWWNGFFLIKSFMQGRYKKNQEVTLLSAREIYIETRRRFHIDVDGDIKTMTPATFKVLPKAVKLIIPEHA